MGDTDNFIEILYHEKIEPKVIYDCGARDCTESKELQKAFPEAKIYAFECNPEALVQCRKNITGTSITLIEAAITDENKEIQFYPTVGNIGASSIFKKSGLYDYRENYNQLAPIIVQSRRLDNLIYDKQILRPDVLWLDIQGAELLALKGLGNYLGGVLAIWTEIELKEMYKDQPLFDEVNAFLVINGFELVYQTELCDNFWGSFCYIRK